DASGNSIITGPVSTTATYHWQAPTHTETVQVNVAVIPLTQVTINNRVYVEWPEPGDGSTTVLQLKHPLEEDRPASLHGKNKSKSVWKTVKESDFTYLNGMKMVRLDRLVGMQFQLVRTPAGGGLPIAWSVGLVSGKRRAPVLQV